MVKYEKDKYGGVGSISNNYYVYNYIYIIPGYIFT
jgi:hypothetical protein